MEYSLSIIDGGKDDSYYCVFIMVGIRSIPHFFYKSGAGDKKGYDQGSMRIMWITISAGITLGVYFARYFRFSNSNSLLITYISLSIIIIGMILRFVAIFQLGRYFTVDVTLRKDHQIIQSGIYKKLRHPSYSGMLLSFLGLALSFNSWASFIIVFLPVTCSVINRMNVEEKFLIQQFGEDYKNYMKKTFRLIPYVY